MVQTKLDLNRMKLDLERMKGQIKQMKHHVEQMKHRMEQMKVETWRMKLRMEDWLGRWANYAGEKGPLSETASASVVGWG